MEIANIRNVPMGGDGGSGAAPLEFSNVGGTPLVEGLMVVHNALVGVNLRHRIKIIASGRIVTGFDIAHKLEIGTDLCNSARAMMFALGCIQAQKCNTNTCPTGIATQDPELVHGLVVDDKSTRVAGYQKNRCVRSPSSSLPRGSKLPATSARGTSSAAASAPRRRSTTARCTTT